MNILSKDDAWPTLDYAAWKDTGATLHMWTQVVGKIKLAQTPWVNHSWHVAFHVTPRGLTTLPIPHGLRTFQIDFDFLSHRLRIEASDGAVASLALEPRSVAAFYHALMDELQRLDLGVKINTMPNEVAAGIPFEHDETHATYDPEQANRFFRALVQADRILKQFRARFIGKCSPVHFFWGSFDLAVTRFSGRPAPPHPGGVPGLPDWVAREAYSQEVLSCGFWPGGEAMPRAVFYAYAYPEPQGFDAAALCGGKAWYDRTLREYLLPYEDVRRAAEPDKVVLEFLQGSYACGAQCGRWDALLEQDMPAAHSAY